QYCCTYPSGRPVAASTVAGHPAHIDLNRQVAHGWPSEKRFSIFPPSIAHTSSNDCSNKFPTICLEVTHVLAPPCTFTEIAIRPAPHEYTLPVGSFTYLSANPLNPSKP